MHRNRIAKEIRSLERQLTGGHTFKTTTHCEIEIENDLSFKLHVHGQHKFDLTKHLNDHQKSLLIADAGSEPKGKSYTEVEVHLEGSRTHAEPDVGIMHDGIEDLSVEVQIGNQKVDLKMDRTTEREFETILAEAAAKDDRDSRHDYEDRD